MKRLVVRIDEEKCNGCGACVPACAEGALQIIDGKARLVSDVLCDGLGACLGECPQGALVVEEREAAAFDEEAVKRHLSALGKAHSSEAHAPRPHPAGASAMAHGGGCPGSRMMTISRPAPVAEPRESEAGAPSELSNWPVQLMLMPTRAPYLEGADLLICADCVPFAYAGFHHNLVRGRVVAIGCPKLDDAGYYAQKLAVLFRENDVNSVTIAHMEVPCCSGLVRVVHQALAMAGRDLPVRELTVTIGGELVE
jgi:NAD-dependent dihydropyrimidine dehydrogenase PreA subunit